MKEANFKFEIGLFPHRNMINKSFYMLFFVKNHLHLIIKY